jgi:hypothetical protein
MATATLFRWLDESLDESGCLPEVLMRAHELATLLPYRQTSEVLRRWGVELGKSLLCSLNEKLNQATQAQGSRKLAVKPSLKLPEPSAVLEDTPLQRCVRCRFSVRG